MASIVSLSSNVTLSGAGSFMMAITVSSAMSLPVDVSPTKAFFASDSFSYAARASLMAASSPAVTSPGTGRALISVLTS